MVNKSDKSIDLSVMQAEGEKLNKLFQGINSSRRAFCIAHELNPTMVQQHISAIRPISLDYARRYADSFGCKIIDFSQRLHNEIAKANAFVEMPTPTIGRATRQTKLILPDGNEYDHQMRDMFKKLNDDNREDALQYVQKLLSKQVKPGTAEKPFPDLAPEPKPKSKPKLDM